MVLTFSPVSGKDNVCDWYDELYCGLQKTALHSNLPVVIGATSLGCLFENLNIFIFWKFITGFTFSSIPTLLPPSRIFSSWRQFQYYNCSSITKSIQAVKAPFSLFPTFHEAHAGSLHSSLKTVSGMANRRAGIQVYFPQSLVSDTPWASSLFRSSFPPNIP